MNEEAEPTIEIDEADPPSRQFDIREMMIAMGILAVGFAGAAHYFPLVMLRDPEIWAVYLGSQIAAFLVGMGLISFTRHEIKKKAGDKLAAAYRDGRIASPPATFRAVNLLVVSSVLSAEIFLFCFLTATSPEADFSGLMAMIGAAGGITMRRFHWWNNRQVVEVYENGISEAPFQFSLWKDLKQLPVEENAELLRFARYGDSAVTPVSVYTLHLPPELRERVKGKLSRRPDLPSLPVLKSPGEGSQ